MRTVGQGRERPVIEGIASGSNFAAAAAAIDFTSTQRVPGSQAGAGIGAVLRSWEPVGVEEEHQVEAVLEGLSAHTKTAERRNARARTTKKRYFFFFFFFFFFLLLLFLLHHPSSCRRLFILSFFSSSIPPRTHPPPPPPPLQRPLSDGSADDSGGCNGPQPFSDPLESDVSVIESNRVRKRLKRKMRACRMMFREKR